MPKPRVFKLREPEERRNNYTRELPQIDKTRATAVLVRRSKRAIPLSEEELKELKNKDGIETAYIESRQAQLELVNYAKLLYGSDTPNVLLYDEGDGVSGQKRIDQRDKMDKLYQDMNMGIIGTVVTAREDRLFRNKHMDQVGVFTKLAEEKEIKAIVPPISSAASNEPTRVYDFTIYHDLSTFQDKMKEAYGYIEGHVKYMNQCKQNKADKGGYDGRGLPPGLAVQGKKQNQKIVIYEPWAEVMKKLALRAQALDWDMGKLNREVAQMARLFPEIPDEHRDRYMIKTSMHHVPGVGYKPRAPQTIRGWLTNVMYIGWWLPDDEKDDATKNHHPAILDYALFAEGYARLTGYTLEGEHVDNARGITRIRKTREVPPDALFHSRLITPPPSADRSAFVSVGDRHHVSCYLGNSMQKNGMLIDRLFCIPVVPFDSLVIERLKTLADKDKEIADKVKTTLEQMYKQQGEEFASIPAQLEGIEIQLLENAKKRFKTSEKDPLYAMLQAEAEDLLQKQAALEAKKDKLGIIDSPEEIARVHRLLGNFDKVWATFDILQKQRVFSLLISRIEVEVVSPHWLHLSIDWLDAVCPRIDDGLIWRVTGARSESFSDQEKEIIKQHYPSLSQLEILKLLPDRTWNAIQHFACQKQIKREMLSGNNIPRHACYRDFMPKLDGRYLFGDYKGTLDYIKKASSSTVKSKAPLYAIWIPTDAPPAGLVEQDLVSLARATRTKCHSTRLSAILPELEALFGLEAPLAS